MIRSLLAAALVVVSLPAMAHEFRLGGLHIDHPYGFPSPGGSGAGYMTLTNEGDAAVTLLSARSPTVPRVEIHTTEVDAAGIARMIEQERVEIAPGATVTFAPRGLHVMFMGLTAPLAEGDRVPVELVFDKGTLPVEFLIEKRGAGVPTHGHGAHGQRPGG